MATEAMTGENPMVHVEKLRKVYAGGVEAVKGIDFDIGANEVFGLLGPNGAGKSTVIGMLTTTIAPTSGSASIAGFDVATAPIAARRISGVVFQEPVIDMSLTGRSNLLTHARLWGLGAKAKAATSAVIDSFDLGDIIDRSVSTYSGGQRRRVEIARSLISNPSVLFLDEPSVGLDPRVRFELMDVIAQLRAGQQTTIVLTTHYLDEAERLCDRVAIVHLGEIVAIDTPAKLLGRLGKEIVELRVIGDPDAAMRTLRSEQIAGMDAFSVGATITVPIHQRPAHEAIVAITELGLHTSISARPPSLDDVYLQLTGASLAA
jgi:ABC-2 type transport system ATP-binding protein